MLSIEQYDEAEERLGRIADDANVLRKRRTDLIELTDKLEGERKSRLTTVLTIVSENSSGYTSVFRMGAMQNCVLKIPKIRSPVA